ncbi:MAG TPA: FIST N-terminal domain-containing protein [Xanthobacteraceae bacterium]|nr:FIST N-terminal domain-containing protein [Xanthobacteraceae bacterium]
MKAATALTSQKDSRAAGNDLLEQLRAGLGDEPSAIVLFAAPTYDHEDLLDRIVGSSRALLVGASSAGEFVNQRRGEGLACALGLAGDDAIFTASATSGLREEPAAAARKLAGQFRGLEHDSKPHRSALVMTDALAGHADVLVEEMTVATSGRYQFFGGGAGDNAQFSRTSVFLGRDVLNDAAVALEILSEKPLGVGVQHGWTPASQALRATDSEGSRLVGINGFPAVGAFEAHAKATNQKFDRNDPIPFFLHNVIGIDTGAGHRIRVPLAVKEDGSVICAAEIPRGSIIRIMKASSSSTVGAAEAAVESALAAMGAHKPGAAIFFDCVATRLRMGQAFEDELEGVRKKLSGAQLMGCNTHGQIARAPGQFEGFHNCTAVVCLLPS